MCIDWSMYFEYRVLWRRFYTLLFALRNFEERASDYSLYISFSRADFVRVKNHGTVTGRRGHGTDCQMFSHTPRTARYWHGHGSALGLTARCGPYRSFFCSHTKTLYDCENIRRTVLTTSVGPITARQSTATFDIYSTSVPKDLHNQRNKIYFNFARYDIEIPLKVF